PVVATSAGGLAEVVGSAGRLVPPGDVDALASAIAEVVDDPAVRAEMGRAGPAQAARFRWDQCGAGLVRLYREAAGKQR
ncbi:MAG: glycosyltransferase, partial [Actinobacteria bacterium]|nr:glycosyltransferase [Actinomycetota bacterium]